MQYVAAMESPGAGEWSGRHCWAVSFVLVSVLAGALALATPLFAAPDEPAHVINAAVIVRGQLLPPEDGGIGRVRIPAPYAQAHGVPQGYAFRSTVPASCARP